MSVLAPTGALPVRGPAPDPGARARPRAPRSARTRACAGTPPRRRWPRCTARARSRPSPRSATRAPTSRTSPRATSTRSASSRSAPAPAGWAATSTAPAPTTTRSRACRSTAASRPTLATADKPVAAVDDVTDYDMYVARRRRPGRPTPMYNSLRPLRRASPRTPPHMTQVRTRHHADQRPARAARRRSTATRRPSPTRTPTSPRKLSGLAAMIGAGLPLSAASRSRPPAATTPTPTRRTLRPTTSAAPATAILAFQRDLEARGQDDRVLMEIWSEFGRRPEENGSARHRPRRRRAAPSSIGTRARGEMVGEFPGLAHASTRTTTCSGPRTSAACTARCSSSGWTRTPTAIIPGEASLPEVRPGRPVSPQRIGELTVVAAAIIALALILVLTTSPRWPRRRGPRGRRSRRLRPGPAQRSGISTSKEGAPRTASW